MPKDEPEFLMEMFAQDSKNYHVWTYRHWLVRHFKRWDDPREMADVDTLLDKDVRNNSAWNHRFMLRFGPRGDEPDSGMPNSGGVPASQKGRSSVVDEDVVDAELEFAKEKILLAPQNRSPWSYARGVLHVSGRPLAEWKGFAGKFIDEELAEDGSVVGAQVRSSHAVEWLADVYAEEKMPDALRMFTLLKERYDPIRKNYWDYRIRMLSAPVAAAV